VNALTANYGFFCYLSLCLHVFLLEDLSLEKAASRRRHFLAFIRFAHIARSPRKREAAAFAIFCAVSSIEAMVAFGPGAPDGLAPLRSRYLPFRFINTYHLFASITRERIEPTFETSEDGASFVEHDLWHKPGSVTRRPDFVAPHQPRVDFQLWFYGLGYQGRTPPYIAGLLNWLCAEPARVQPLFRDPLPMHPKSVRIRFWRYHFATPAQQRQDNRWWNRELADQSRDVPCSD
jgi:hypothetical protein